MIKSIVVALDGTDSSRTAQDLALDIAKDRGTALVGVGVLDVPWITAPRATPLGAGAYKTHRDEVLLEKGRAQIKQRLADFHARCAREGAVSREIGAEGVPHELIEREADRHDLIIVGRDTNFHGVQSPDIGDTVERLLHDNPRPVLVVPAEHPPGQKVVVAYDGSMQSSRAMHMFVLLGLTRDREVHVVSVDENEGKALDLASRACGLFEAHEIAVQSHGIKTTAHPADVLLGELDGLDAGMLVMGAFSHHGLVHRMFVGSATRRLLHRCPVPLFVHH